VLMAAIGSFLGWQPTLIVFFLAPACALAVITASWIFRRDREIPYGPYLSLATLCLILGWKHIWPSAEFVFSLGLFVPVIGILMCAMLFLSLQITQLTKRLLGWTDDLSDLENGWHAGDQLFHFASQNTDSRQIGWNRPQWPGVESGRGSLGEQRWRKGR